MKLRRMTDAPRTDIIVGIELKDGTSTWAHAALDDQFSWRITLTGWTVGPNCEGYAVFDAWGDELPIGVIGWIPAPELTP